MVSPQSIFSAAQSGDEERLRWLIESGLHNSNDTNKHCMTALHYAMMNDHKACTMLLLDAGADPYVENTLGQTPLQVRYSGNKCSSCMVTSSSTFLTLSGIYLARNSTACIFGKAKT